MKNVLILHGVGGNPRLNWYQYIATNAAKAGYRVLVPPLPYADKPNLEATYSYVSRHFTFNEKTIMVGHSSGACLALGILQKLPSQIRIHKTILISGFIDPFLTAELHRYIPRSDYDNLFPKRWYWKKIKDSCSRFIFFYSPSDPFVQMRHAETLQYRLSGELILIQRSKHFSVASGGKRFNEFPLLLEKILG
jgi:predicted alpha/beta hydrolase family esterase